MTLHSMSQTKKNGTTLFRVDVIFEWYEGAMVFRIFIFIFGLETTVRENSWVGRTSVAVIVKFFRKYNSESTSSQLCSKFILNNYEAPWQRHLKDTVQLNILRTWINTDVEPAKRHFIYYWIHLFLSNKPSLKI